MPFFSRRMLYITFGVLGVILIAALLFWLFARRVSVTPSTPPVQQADQHTPQGSGGNLQQPTGTTFVPKTPTTTPPAPGNISLQQTAFLFTERYGSYSTESNFSNFADVRSLITDRLANQLRAVEGRGVTNTTYIGLVTKALQYTLVDENNAQTSAMVKVRAQRQETKGVSATPRVYYQDIKLSLIKIDDAWLVDQADWQ